MKSDDRVAWIDYAKGVSILLVVIFHVVHGILLRPDDIPFDSTWYDPVNAVLALVRMPSFFFVSGLLVAGSVKRDARTFIVGKLSAYMWPYLVWSTIHVTLASLLARPGPTSAQAALPSLPVALVLNPVGQFWFLYSLFLSVIVFYLLRRLGLSAMAILVLWLLVDTCRFTMEWQATTITMGPYHFLTAIWWPFFEFINLFPYLTIGAIVSAWMMRDFVKLPSLAAALLVIVSMVALWFAVGAGIDYDSAVPLGRLLVPYGWTLSVVGICGAMCAALLASRTEAFKFLRSLGRYSLYIFVTHVICAAAMRTLLLRLGVHDLSVHLVIGMVAGLVPGIAAAHLARPAHLEWLFSLRSAGAKGRRAPIAQAALTAIPYGESPQTPSARAAKLHD